VILDNIAKEIINASDRIALESCLLLKWPAVARVVMRGERGAQ
jgi:hypothetical protein